MIYKIISVKIKYLKAFFTESQRSDVSTKAISADNVTPIVTGTFATSNVKMSHCRILI